MAQLLPVAAYRGRAAGFLHAEQGFCVEFVVGRSMFEADLAEIHFQLLGEQHGHGGIRPLAHFHLVHHERHAPVPPDPDEGIGCQGVDRGGFGVTGQGRESDAQQQPAPGGSGRQECAARERVLARGFGGTIESRRP